MDAEATIHAYYDALRRGEPLEPYFADDPEVVKFGITERLVGHESIAAGLREQTRTTTDWTVESRRLTATERDRHAWFADDVRMAWTDTETGARYDYGTRWSGALERRSGCGDGDRNDRDDRHEQRASDRGRGGEGDSDDADDWRFVGMHVSVAEDELTERTEADGAGEGTSNDSGRRADGATGTDRRGGGATGSR
jgi:hypothetical protein